MTADIEQRFAAVDDTVATLEERLDAVEAHVVEHTKKMDSIFRLLGGWLDQQVNQAKQAMDPQQVMINNARSSRGTPPQRTQGPAGPVQSAEAFDGAVDRINNKRRELLGAKK